MHDGCPLPAGREAPDGARSLAARKSSGRWSRGWRPKGGRVERAVGLRLPVPTAQAFTCQNAARVDPALFWPCSSLRRPLVSSLAGSSRRDACLGWVNEYPTGSRAPASRRRSMTLAFPYPAAVQPCPTERSMFEQTPGPPPTSTDTTLLLRIARLPSLPDKQVPGFVAASPLLSSTHDSGVRTEAHANRACTLACLLSHTHPPPRQSDLPAPCARRTHLASILARANADQTVKLLPE